MRTKIEIVDTTLRDGEQMDGVSYNSQEKIMIAKRLFDIGVSRIEVASANAVDEDKRALEEICKMANVLGRLRDVEVLGFVNKQSVDWIANCGCKTINLLTKGSKEHREGQLKKSLEQHLNDIEQMTSYAVSKGMNANVYLEDWSGGMLNSKQDVMSMIGAIKNFKGVKRIMLADTVGKLSYWQTGDFVKRLVIMFPGVHFDYHGHNDYELAVANALEAIKAGINGVHVTLNGLGERAGNASLYSVVAAAKDHLGLDLGIDEKSFKELSEMVELASKIRLSPHFPVVGSNVYKQTAGIHGDGDKKGKLYIGRLTPARFGGDETEYSLGKNAGNANVEINLRRMGVEAEPVLIKRLTQLVRELGEKKTAVRREDLYLLYLDEIEKAKERPFEILDCSSDVNLNGARRGHLRVKLNGKVYEDTGLGDGGYDAIMNALRKITDRNSLVIPRLVDYDVRIPPGGGTGALVEAVITWKNGDRGFKTTGVDTDQTIAAVRATEKMLNIYLSR